jgi:hypothetical protein
LALALRSAERGHLGRIGLHVDLALQAAVRDHVGDARHLQELGPHDPVLQRPQRHGIGVRAVERVAVHLADRRRHRAERRPHALGQLRAVEALDHLLARAQRIEAVLEGERDERQPEERDAAQPEEPRRAVERALERQRHAPLHLLRRLPRIQRDDLDLRIRGIGERLDGEPDIGVIAPGTERERDEHRREPVLQRKTEERIEHGALCGSVIAPRQWHPAPIRERGNQPQ